jgi:DNA-binding PadR family transcriptional regulator
VGKPDIPSLTAKEFLIMGILVANAGKRLYGLELVERSNGELKKGTVYVFLSRLTKKGYVTSEREAEARGIATPRRFYKTTGEGAKVYHAIASVGGAQWLQAVLA